VINLLQTSKLPLLIGAIVVIAGLVFFMGGGDKTAKKSGDSSQPIVIPTHNWSSQVVMAHVIGGIFESMGNNVKYVPADSQAVYESIRIGDVTLAHEVWESAFGKSFDTAREKGGVLDWGDHEARTIEDMGYPDWAAKYCPGLPDWNALKSPDCAKAFATPDSGGKGRMLEGPQSWHGDLIPQRIEALGLGDLWTVKFAGGADALWAELKAAEAEGRGTIIFNWTPNFTDGAGFTFIKFPPYYDGCRPADGGDGKCGSPDGYLKKAVNDKFPKTHPHAARIFKKLSFTTSQIGAMAALVDLDKMTHEDAAKKWLADNEAVWKPWTK
jgi:glycine betaine/proline transport system substrate-binding protein